MYPAILRSMNTQNRVIVAVNQFIIQTDEQRSEYLDKQAGKKAKREAKGKKKKSVDELM